MSLNPEAFALTLSVQELAMSLHKQKTFSSIIFEDGKVPCTNTSLLFLQSACVLLSSKPLCYTQVGKVP